MNGDSELRQLYNFQVVLISIHFWENDLSPVLMCHTRPNHCSLYWSEKNKSVILIKKEISFKTLHKIILS